MAGLVTTHFLEDIPFAPDVPALMKHLRVKENSPEAAELTCLVDSARSIARPKALYLETYVGERGENWINIAGVRFTSRVLCVNLEQAYRVFPYLATCGLELQDWAAGMDDLLLGYWAEALKEAALRCALQAFDRHLEEHHRPGQTARMSPGSLPDWPIEEQRNLFALFGSHAAQIGVMLSSSLLMIPTKTVSGIRFPTEVEFESCQLCGREDCPGRRAPYDPQLSACRYNLP